MFTNEDTYFDPNVEKKYNRVLERYCNYYDLLHQMLAIDKQLEEAYNLKESLKYFFDKSDIDTAKENLNALIKEFKSSTISVMNDFWNTMVRWKN